MRPIEDMSTTEACLSGLEHIDFGYKRIRRIDDSYMMYGFECWDVFITQPDKLTLLQKERLIHDGISAEMIAERISMLS